MQVRLVNQLKEIERLAAVVESFAAAHDVSADIAYAFNLSLDEIVTNIILYAFDDAQEHQIDVQLGFVDGIMAARVEDSGRPFNPLDIPAPDLDAPIEKRRV